MSATASANRTGAAAARGFAQLGTLCVRGPDAIDWLNGVLTCDVSKCRPGQATWGLALDRKGKVQSVVWLIATPDGLRLGVSQGTASALFTHLDRMLVMEDAELSDESDDYTWALCIGELPPQDAEFPDHHALRLVTLDAHVVCYRTTAPPPWLAKLSSLDDAAWAELRLTHGVVEYGVDFDAGDRPHEAGLERRAVDWSKGCYLGQEVVCMQDMRGKVSRRATLLRIEGGPALALAAGADVTSTEASAAIGQLSSCAYSPATGAWFGFAMLPVARLDSELWVQSASVPLRAQPVSPPVQPLAP